MTNNTLYNNIKAFYDNSTPLWEKIWGEHLHHGYYGADGTETKDHKIAQVDLINELLTWSNIDLSQCQNFLDVGCGIGGSTFHLLSKTNPETKAIGITLSPVQVDTATKKAAANYGDRATFLVGDAIAMPFDDNTFDLVWSLESAEHFPDKEKFLTESYRVLKPNGRLILATWCHRPIDPPYPPLTNLDKKHLDQIYEAYLLPYIISLPQYQTLADQIGFQEIKTADWSKSVAPFWDAVLWSALNPLALIGLFTSDWVTIKTALSLNLMISGYQTGLIRFGLLTGIK